MSHLPPTELDTRLLGPALAEFVILADTHHMLDGAEHGEEFASRGKQNERIGWALTLAASVDPAFCLHLGDHVQDYPGSETFAPTVDGAVEQLGAAPLRYLHVAGNTDVGDKPDPTSPGRRVQHDALDDYAAAYGPSWYAADEGSLRIVVLNASILNSGLAEETAQWDWLTAELSVTRKRRILCLHYPLYLDVPTDRALGNYDVVAEPARSRVLDVIDEHDIELVLSGHSHWAFFNRVGAARMMVAPSTSFTRPGFSEVFSSAAPPERGRDDEPKLGFLLARVHASDIRLHFVRTVRSHAVNPVWRQVVTPLPADRGIGTGRVEIALRHPVTSRTVVPVAFPSVVPQPVRNDYPMLAVIELGAGSVRIPAAHLSDPLQRERLAVLRAEGVQVTVSAIGRSGELDHRPAWLDEVDLIEFAVPRGDDEALEDLDRCGDVPIRLTPLVYEGKRPGHELPRARQMFRIDDLDEIERAVSVPGARRSIEMTPGLCTALSAGDVSALLPWVESGVDLVISLGDLTPSGAPFELAQMMLAAATVEGARIIVDPLVELDRTMDRLPGLLDRMCNPTELFEVVRLLTALLGTECWRAAAGVFSSPDHSRMSLIDTAPQGHTPIDHGSLCALLGLAASSSVSCYDLGSGTVLDVPIDGVVAAPFGSLLLAVGCGVNGAGHER